MKISLAVPLLTVSCEPDTVAVDPVAKPKPVRSMVSPPIILTSGVAKDIAPDTDWSISRVPMPAKVITPLVMAPACRSRVHRLIVVLVAVPPLATTSSPPLMVVSVAMPGELRLE